MFTVKSQGREKDLPLNQKKKKRFLRQSGFRSRGRPKPGYLAGAGADTLARLRIHRKYLFNNSRKLHGTYLIFKFFKRQHIEKLEMKLEPD